MLKDAKPTLPICRWGVPDEFYTYLLFCRKDKCQYYGRKCRDDCKEREPMKHE